MTDSETKVIEYREVTRVSVHELNDLGDVGWRPGPLRYENHEGWTGLLWREVPKIHTFDLASS